MDESESDAEELLPRWRDGRLDAATLYAEVSNPMRQAARMGIRSITSSHPDDHDVEDVVVIAFTELERKDSAEISSIIGLAKAIAYRRGQDRGRQVVRRREQIDELVANMVATSVTEFSDDIVHAAEEDEELLAMAEDCLEHLPEEHRDLVVHTIMGQETLSDWALRKGKSHQAASKQKRKAIEAIQRCIKAKQREGTTGREKAP